MSASKTQVGNSQGHSTDAVQVGSSSPFTIKIDFYSDNSRVCLLVYQEGELYGKLSTNVDHPLADNKFAAKTYSENKVWARKLLSAYPQYFEPVGKTIVSDTRWVPIPIYRITPQFIEEQFEATYDKYCDVYNATPPLWSLYKKYVKKL